MRACLERRPLLIAGYSGYDDDIFPVLKACMEQGRILGLTIVVHPGSSQADPVRYLSGIGGVELVEADILPVLARWGRRSDEPVATADGHAEGDNTRSDAIYRSAASSVPLIRIAYTIALLHEVVGHPPGVVKYGRLADDIFADKRYRAQSEPYAVSIFNDLARASAGTANVIDQREFLTTAADIDSHDREAQLHRPFYFQQQLEQQCRSDLSKVDALLLKATLDPKEEVDLEAAVQRTVRFTNTVEYRQSQLRAFARWGLGKWRRRQSQLEEALAAFGAVEDVTFDILGDLGPGRFLLDFGGTQVDFFYQQNRGKDGWVEGSLEHLQLGQKMLWASVDLAEKVSDHETAAKACIALARVFVTYDDATALNAARSALARAEDHATAITAADRLLADRLLATISDLKRRVAARS